MNDKKHIDRLFQEGFKNFEATPSDAVWKNIKSQLNKKKKKRRVIPIWWRYAGIAATLLLLLTLGNLGNLFFNSIDKNSTNQVVDTENVIPENNKVENNDPINESVKTNIVISDNKKNDSNENSSTQPEVKADAIETSKETSIAETSASKNQNESKTNLTSSDKLNINKNIVTPRNNNGIANNSSKIKSNTKNTPKELENNVGIVNTSEDKNKTIDNKNETQLINKDKAKTLISEASKDNTAIANTNKEKIDKKTKADKSLVENKHSIEEAINNAKDVIEEDSNKLSHRWRVAPNAAPVYFNTLGEGSSIDPQFNSNSKSGEVNMSYGISASYAITKKLSIRSGINRVNLGYNTNNAAVFQSVGLSSRSSALQNVSPSNNADDVSVISTKSLKNTPNSFASTNTSINQDLGYIEIPLEIQYALSDKKFGINLIGGFSSFFLNNNEIFSEEENGDRTFLGEANNINDISYSANFGLGLNYKVTKKFDLNLEPIFKYQFNTFNNTSGNFSPFIIGVYTGFSIKF